MQYAALLERARGLPVIESVALRAWGEDPRALAVQLSRWVRAGKLIALRRGVYLLPRALRFVEPPAEYLANLLVTPSYVSLERALAIHGLIPERVPLVQSVTTARPALFRTAEGEFQYRHVKTDWFRGYVEMPIGGGTAMVATPEKALLDLVHLSSGPYTPGRIEELRLQNHERVDLAALERLASGRGKRLEQSAHDLAHWIRRDRKAGRQ